MSVRDVAARLRDRANCTLFEEVDGQVFALMRLAFGLLGLLNLWGTTPVAMYWDLNGGLIPLPGDGLGIRALIAASGLGTAAGYALFTLAAGAYGAMVVGVLPNVAVPIAFVATVAQTYWNNLPLSSAHQVLVVVLFALAFADCGQFLTLAGGRRGGYVHRMLRQPIWPLRLIQFQVALLYLNSGLWKFYGPSWRDGSAIYWALNHDIFHRWPILVPDWAVPLTAVGTYLTLGWEIGFPVLVAWRRTRLLALGLGVLLHAGVWLTLEVGPFSVMIMATYLAFLDPRAVARVVDRLRARRGVPLPATPSVKTA